MTPGQAKLLEQEAAAWKSRDGRRAMKVLDLSLNWAVAAKHVMRVAVVRWEPGDYRLALRNGAGWTGYVDSVLAVEFLKARAMDVAGEGGRWPYRTKDGWSVVLANTVSTFPTESHALIAAILAGGAQ